MENQTQELLFDDAGTFAPDEALLKELGEAWDDAEGEREAQGQEETDDLEADQPKQTEPKAAGEPKPGGAGTEKPERETTDAAEEAQNFTLKHLGELRTVGKDEVVRLAQQGLDYQRIRAERDWLRAALRGETEPGARSAAVRAEERKEDIRRFLREFPAVKPEEIPKEVWGQVAEGEGLASAYALHRSRQLEAELAAERQNRRNAQNTTGSLAGGIKGIPQDEFLKWWEDED